MKSFSERIRIYMTTVPSFSSQTKVNVKHSPIQAHPRSMTTWKIHRNRTTCCWRCHQFKPKDMGHQNLNKFQNLMTCRRFKHSPHSRSSNRTHHQFKNPPLQAHPRSANRTTCRTHQQLLLKTKPKLMKLAQKEESWAIQAPTTRSTKKLSFSLSWMILQDSFKGREMLRKASESHLICKRCNLSGLRSLSMIRLDVNHFLLKLKEDITMSALSRS